MVETNKKMEKLKVHMKESEILYTNSTHKL